MTMTATNRPRIDWKTERDRIDLAMVATNLLGPAPGRRGGSGLWWRCPFHEDRNPSFHVDPVRRIWKCFGCSEHGDAAALVMRINGVKFRDAIAELTGGRAPSAPSKSRPAPTPRPAPEIKARGVPETDALALVEESERRLWSSQGRIALARLRGPERRLTDATIKAARIGLTASVQIPKRDGSGSYWASGIVIPWFDGDRLTSVKVRQPDGRKPKYAEAFRSADFISLYPGRQTIQPGKPLVIVEGEFDALLLGQELAGLAPVVSLGSASSRIDSRIMLRLRSACPWYIATDADPAGDTAAERWPRSARRARPPTLRPHPDDASVKQSTDWCDLKAFGVDLRRWWTARLAGVENPPLFSWDELAAWRWGPAEDDSEPGILIDGPEADQTPEAAV